VICVTFVGLACRQGSEDRSHVLLVIVSETGEGRACEFGE
jgi:hypothetical protein